MDNSPRRSIRGLPPRFEAPPAKKDPGMAGYEYYDIKTRIHDRLIDLIDLSLLDSLDPAALSSEIARLVEKLLREEFAQTPLNQGERERLIGEVQDEMLGLGPLEPFLKDPTVNDILVNSYRQIYVERSGKAGAYGVPASRTTPT
jgi:pilus assembly protein CpaF